MATMTTMTTTRCAGRWGLSLSLVGIALVSFSAPSAGAATPVKSNIPGGYHDFSAPGAAKTTSKQSAGAKEQGYTFNWNIPAGNALLIPAFACPSDAPVVKGSGIYRYNRKDTKKTGDKLAQVGVISADASDGVGYGSFTYATFGYNDNDNHKFMTGWNKGTLLTNNAFAPAFKGGTFKVSVTCTSAISTTAAAWAKANNSIGRGVFPWAP